MSAHSETSVTLLVPGLLGTLDICRQFQMGTEIRDGLRPLEQWFTHARPIDDGIRGFEPVLFSLFGMAGANEADLPVAPLSLYADTGEPPAGHWLRADPVYLQADRDRVLMTALSGDNLDKAAADSLVTELNEFFQPLGYSLTAPVPQRWYLRLPHAPALRTSPVKAVIGHDVHDHMPRGDDARQWRALLNEVQMLLHGSEANRLQQAQGMKTVNSLWFWGAGSMPPVGTGSWDHVWGEEPLLEGLALHHGVPLRALPADGEGWLSSGCAPGRHLMVYDGFLQAAQQGDFEVWARQMEVFSQSWCQPLLQALKKRDIARASLFPAHGKGYEITPRALGRWWKRRARLAAFLDESDNLYPALS